VEATVVLSIDPWGTGETRVDTDVNSREFDHYFGDFSDIMTALLVGKTMAGMRALDISRGVDVLTSRKEVDPKQVYAYGKEEGALPLLYAAVLDGKILGRNAGFLRVGCEQPGPSAHPGRRFSRDVEILRFAGFGSRPSAAQCLDCEWYRPTGT
jgi:hypothetical protein